MDRKGLFEPLIAKLGELFGKIRKYGLVEGVPLGCEVSH